MTSPDFRQEEVLAVVVAFNPDEGFAERLERVSSQVSNVVVVDNGSTGVGKLPSSVRIVRNPDNLGVARALNQGLEIARESGATWAVTMDQDTAPMPGMVEGLLDVYRRHPRRDRIAIVAPQIEDPLVPVQARFLRPRGPFLFERSPCTGQWLDGVSMVITAGALHSLAAYQRIGGFRDDFFIDYVDTEYCLRARRHGYEIVVACDARLQHRLGDRQERVFLGRPHYPTFHSPDRWYYINRNRIPMLRTYGTRFPHWLTYEIVASTYGILRMLLFEDQRIEKLRAIFEGTLDGLRGRMGPRNGSSG